MALSNPELAGWEKLACTCGCREFVAKVTINWKPGGGTTTTPAGHRCRDCGADVDAAGLIKVAERAQKRRELAQLQADLAEPLPTPVTTRDGR